MNLKDGGLHDLSLIVGHLIDLTQSDLISVDPIVPGSGDLSRVIHQNKISDIKPGFEVLTAVITDKFSCRFLPSRICLREDNTRWSGDLVHQTYTLLEREKLLNSDPQMMTVVTIFTTTMQRIP